MPPERTDLERLVSLENQVQTMRSDIESMNGDVKAAALASQVRHKDSDEVYRVVMDDKEGLRSRVRDIEKWQHEVMELKAFVTGQLKTWIIVGCAIVSIVQIVLKFWKP